MDDTTNLKLPYIIAAQAQKHVTHNEAIRALDCIVQLSVLDRDLATPPNSPVNGDRYIVAAPANGDWAGQENNIASWQDNAWMFYPPQEGWLCWIADEDTLLAFDGSAWSEVSGSGGGSVNPTPMVGVNATADTANRLAVKSANSLFDHEGSDHRIKINKAAQSNTASLLFQDNYQGRAEIGLAGDDDFHFKVSADGVNWKEAILVSGDTGEISLPQSSFTSNMLFNLFQDAGRFSGSPEAQGSGVGSFVAPTYLTPYNGAAFSGHAKFLFDNSTHGGSAGALDPDVDELAVSLKSATWLARYGPEFWAMKITCGSGTASAKTTNGVIRYYVLTNPKVPLWTKSTWGLNVKVLSGSLAVNGTASNRDVYQGGVKVSSDIVIQNSDGWQQIVYVGTQDQRDNYGYNGGLFSFYAEPSSEILVALPFMFPGQITPRPGNLFGRVPSLEAWR